MGLARIEHMFDKLAGLDEVELLVAMSEAQRDERRAVARRLVAAGRLCQRRIADSGEDEQQWCIDNWEEVAAEVGAELGVSRGRASAQMEYGKNLVERFPKLAQVFWGGDVDYRIITAIDFRTGLITDPEILQVLDAELAERAPYWNHLSRDRIAELIDWRVLDVDPEALRISRQRDADRHIDVHPGNGGTADIAGNVRGLDGAAFGRRLDELAATVCRDDPRTKRQRRADAVGALAQGQDIMACLCGSADCPAGPEAAPKAVGSVVYVIAEQATVRGEGTRPGYQPGIGAVTADVVSTLARKSHIKTVPHPSDLRAEPQYRPSVPMARFIRCRDLTCRWPGCSVPAERCDIDHTVPHPVGPTHPSNCKLYCRTHHLIKTFFSGPDGWREQQMPDGTMLFISPSGRRYITKPQGALFFPQLATPTETLRIPEAPQAGGPSRRLAMPTRQRTRAQDRAYRINWERGVNKRRWDADPPPF